jgi:hypothetical protein
VVDIAARVIVSFGWFDLYPGRRAFLGDTRGQKGNELLGGGKAYV